MLLNSKLVLVCWTLRVSHAAELKVITNQFVVSLFISLYFSLSSLSPTSIFTHFIVFPFFNLKHWPHIFHPHPLSMACISVSKTPKLQPLTPSASQTGLLIAAFLLEHTPVSLQKEPPPQSRGCRWLFFWNRQLACVGCTSADLCRSEWGKVSPCRSKVWGSMTWRYALCFLYITHNYVINLLNHSDLLKYLLDYYYWN